MHSVLRLSALTLTCLFAMETAWAERPEVKLVGDHESGYQLMVDGEPYFVKGAGGHQYLDQLVAAGGNSIRTWGVGPETRELLDEAHAKGVTVTLGIWLMHERHGFDYSDRAQVEEQLEKVRQAVLDFRDHPAVIIWGVGNEMEVDGQNKRVYDAVNEAAELVKSLDPTRPVMTVIAELGADGEKSRDLHERCPAVDIIGINTYAGIESVAERYFASGGTKPYMITEFGPPGHWEWAKTAWGSPAEPSSTEKEAWYRKGYASAVLARPAHCLGSYVFLWGAKQETTATWYGMFLDDGTRLGAVDVMTELWSGRLPSNRSPRIEGLGLKGAEQVAPGQLIEATLAAADPEGDALRVEWVLRSAATELGWGGDAEDRLKQYDDTVVVGKPDSAIVRMPEQPGPYRLFAYVYDGQGNGAVANVQLLVDAGTRVVEAGEPLDAPRVLYDEPDDGGVFAPSGYMGNTEAITMDLASKDEPKLGAHTLRVMYSAADEWGGVVWQHPANDWGDQAGGLDLRGARKLTFWARGAQGGETVKFGFGVIGRDKPFYDTAQAEDEFTLTDEWKQYSFDLAGKDLSRIKTGFMWALSGQGQPVVFYLDGIQYE